MNSIFRYSFHLRYLVIHKNVLTQYLAFIMRGVPKFRGVQDSSFKFWELSTNVYEYSYRNVNICFQRALPDRKSVCVNMVPFKFWPLATTTRAILTYIDHSLNMNLVIESVLSPTQARSEGSNSTVRIASMHASYSERSKPNRSSIFSYSCYIYFLLLLNVSLILSLVNFRRNKQSGGSSLSCHLVHVENACQLFTIFFVSPQSWSSGRHSANRSCSTHSLPMELGTNLFIYLFRF